MEEIKYIGKIKTSPMNPAYDDILKANSMKSEKIRKSPLVYSRTFSLLSGSKVYLKSEFQQKTGAFKIRGAYYKLYYFVVKTH